MPVNPLFFPISFILSIYRHPHFSTTLNKPFPFPLNYQKLSICLLHGIIIFLKSQLYSLATLFKLSPVVFPTAHSGLIFSVLILPMTFYCVQLYWHPLPRPHHLLALSVLFIFFPPYRVPLKKISQISVAKTSYGKFDYSRTSK